jgi:hypothetical protein
MKTTETLKIFRVVCISVGLAVALTAMPTLADDMAAIAPADSRARASFTKFAQSWMEKVQRMAKDQKPTARPGASNTMLTYRDYTDDFTVELRPTGHASSPYVGILRYNEQIFSCRDVKTNDCTMSSQIPVTEIFRYQDGRWVY